MTEAQRIEAEAKGFLTLPGVLQGAELDRVREASERVEARWREDKSLPGMRSAVLDQVQGPIEYDDALLELLWHPKVFPVVREWLGDDVAMVDNDLFLTPPHTPKTHADWHHDVGMPGVYHPRSVMMVKVFFLLTDVDESSGGTAMVPGSHKFEHWTFPQVSDPKTMPGAIQMTGNAGDAYVFNGRVYHCAVNNDSPRPRRVLIYNYGHHWMKPWTGYEPSPRLQEKARQSGDPIQMQLLHLGDAYGSRLN